LGDLHPSSPRRQNTNYGASSHGTLAAILIIGSQSGILIRLCLMVFAQILIQQLDMSGKAVFSRIEGWDRYLF
jgi:hypothetical protein